MSPFEINRVSLTLIDASNSQWHILPMMPAYLTGYGVLVHPGTSLKTAHRKDSMLCCSCYCACSAASLLSLCSVLPLHVATVSLPPCSATESATVLALLCCVDCHHQCCLLLLPVLFYHSKQLSSLYCCFS